MEAADDVAIATAGGKFLKSLGTWLRGYSRPYAGILEGPEAAKRHEAANFAQFEREVRESEPGLASRAAAGTWALAMETVEFVGCLGGCSDAGEGGKPSVTNAEAAKNVAIAVAGGKLLQSFGRQLEGALAGDAAVDAATARGGTKAAESLSEGPIHVTPQGVALPAEGKYQIPSRYVENPYRAGSYGEMVNGKFVERLRIDPPTPPGTKGPNYSHYHLDGKGRHYSPRPGDPDPGFPQ